MVLRLSSAPDSVCVFLTLPPDTCLQEITIHTFHIGNIFILLISLSLRDMRKIDSVLAQLLNRVSTH